MTDIGRAFREWVVRQQVDGYVFRKVDDSRFRFDSANATAEINLYPYGDSEITEYRIVRGANEETTFFLHFELSDLARAEELFGQLTEALVAEGKRETTHVLLTCTSALTTTYFATKLNEAAQTLGLDYDFTALSVDRAVRGEGDFAAVVIAPQAAYMRPQLVEAYPQAVVFEMPAKIFGSYDAPAAFRLTMHALREFDLPGDYDYELRAVKDLSDDRCVLVITLFGMREFTRLGYRLYDKGEAVTQGVLRKSKLDFRDVSDLIDGLLAREVISEGLDAIAIAVPGVACRGVVTLPEIYDEPYDLGQSLTRRFGIPVYVDNNCNAAAVGCYVSQNAYESLVFYRQGFGHDSGGLGTVIDGRLLKGRANLAGEPKYFEKGFDIESGYDNAIWTAEGMHEIAKNVSLACVSVVAPEALYLSVDTVDDAEEFRAMLAESLGVYTPDIHLVRDYVERVYLGELAMCLQKLRDPNYRSLGVGVLAGETRR